MSDEPREIVTAPLAIADGTPADVRLEAVRELMMNGFGPIVEAGIQNLVMPHQREAFLIETAHFVVYYLAIRLNDERRCTPELRFTAQCFRTLHKGMETAVLDQLAALSGAYRAGELG